MLLYQIPLTTALNMLSLVAREEFAPDGIVVSLVYPSVTATEFQDKLRAGAVGVGGGGRTLHTPRYVAKAMVRAIRTGEAEVVIPTVLSARRRWRYPTCRDDRAISPNPIYEASCYRTVAAGRRRSHPTVPFQDSILHQGRSTEQVALLIRRTL